MGRKPRQFQPGKIYHIVQRGHNKTHIFEEQKDKSSFLEMIKESQKSCPFHLLYYVLMDNHYHLVVEMQLDTLDIVMQRINMAYCRHYNRKYNKSGTAFGGRYKSYPVTDRSYFVKLIQYVANNPVKAGMVRLPSDYRWSAHSEAASSKNGVVSMTRLFELLGGTAERGRKAYDKLVKQLAADVARASARSAANDTMSINGTTSSASRTIQNTTNANSATCDWTSGENRDRLSEFDDDDSCDIEFDKERRMEQLKIMLGRIFNMEKSIISVICSKNRELHTIHLRRQFIQQAIDHGYTIAEIAQLLNISSRCVRESVREQRQEADDSIIGKHRHKPSSQTDNKENDA